MMSSSVAGLIPGKRTESQLAEVLSPGTATSDDNAYHQYVTTMSVICQAWKFSIIVHVSC